ncbi:MAG TPA: hypothetical protein VF228_18975 [Iamia sp.]
MRPRRLIQLAAGAVVAVAMGTVGAVPPASAGYPVTVLSGSVDVLDADEDYVDTISFTGPSCDDPFAELTWTTMTFGLAVQQDRRAAFGGDTFRMVIDMYVGGIHTSPDLLGWGTAEIDATLVTPGTCTPVTGAGVCEVELAGINVTGSESQSLLTLVGDSWDQSITVTGAAADCGDLALADAGSVDPFGIIVSL